MALIPQLPSVPTDSSAELKRFLTSLKEIMEVREGTRGTTYGEQYVTRNALSAMGINLNSSTQFPTTQPTGTITGDVNPPGVPTNFAVEPIGVNSHILTWTNATDADLWAVEVWSSSTNNLTTATLLVIVTIPDSQRGQQSIFKNSGIVTAEDTYYWIRSRDWSWNGSNFAAVGMVLAEDNPTLSELIGELTEVDYDMLSEDLQNNIDLAAGLDGKLVLAANVDGHISGMVFDNNGVTTDVSIVCNTFKIIDNTNPLAVTVPFAVGTIDGDPAVGISGSLIVDGTIHARSLQAGTITADKIASGTITADQISAGTLVAIDWKGAYEASTVYQAYDVVSYDGGSWIYINVTPGAGHTPADDAYWDVQAAAGDTGDTGVSSRTVSLTINDLAATYDVSGNRIAPYYSYATAVALNTSGTVYYDFLLNGSSVQNTTSGSYT